MADEPRLENDVRAYRDRLGWSQDELARRSGLSRAGISAIETGRLVPSTGAALALARAFGCTVEDLFRLPRVESATGVDDSAWAWPAPQSACRYWRAEVNGITRAYPVEFSPLGLLPHDGTFEDGTFRDHARAAPTKTLVIACCDPAVGLIAQELAREGDVRLIVLQRSSHAALDLLEKGLVHAAGVHLARADEPEGNLAAVRDFFRAGSDHRLLRVADWDEGIALAPGLGLTDCRGRDPCQAPLGLPGGRFRGTAMSRRGAGRGDEEAASAKLQARLRPPRGGRCHPQRLGRRGRLPAVDQPGGQPRFPEHKAGGLRPLLPFRTGRGSSRPVPDPNHPLLRVSSAARRTPGLRYNADRGDDANRPKRGEEKCSSSCGSVTYRFTFKNGFAQNAATIETTNQ